MAACIRGSGVEGADHLRAVAGRPQVWIGNHRSYVDTQVTDGLGDLAWSPDGSEVWFTAARQGALCALHAVDLGGRDPCIGIEYFGFLDTVT